MNASVTLQDGMHFVGTADSGFSIDLDAGANVGGSDKGSRPLELLAISLVGCTAMDVISILRKMRQDVVGFKVNFSGGRAAEHPKVFTHIQVEYVIEGRELDVKMVERAIELSAKRYCPVQAMIETAVPITHTYTLIPV
jgi:putative redox protein